MHTHMHTHTHTHTHTHLSSRLWHGTYMLAYNTGTVNGMGHFGIWMDYLRSHSGYDVGIQLISGCGRVSSLLRIASPACLLEHTESRMPLLRVAHVLLCRV
jgi:hypothetical protein